MDSIGVLVIAIAVFGVMIILQRRAEAERARLREAERQAAKRRKAKQEEEERREAEQREAERQAAILRRIEAERREAERIEAERHEAERQKVELQASTKRAVQAAVNAAAEAAIIHTGAAEHTAKVTNVAANAIEAVGIAESAAASRYTRAGRIPAARKIACIDATERASKNATEAARKAAGIDPAQRMRIIKEARITAIEGAMRMAVKNMFASSHASEDFREIKNLRANAITAGALAYIHETARQIDRARTSQLSGVRTSESERLAAILDAIEEPGSAPKSIAIGIAARVEADNITGRRKHICDETIDAIITKALEFAVQDANARAEAGQETIVTRIKAAAAIIIIDLIEGAVEAAVASTRLQTGLIEDTVESTVASAIEVDTEEAITAIAKWAVLNTGGNEPA